MKNDKNIIKKQYKKLEEKDKFNPVEFLTSQVKMNVDAVKLVRKTRVN
ncbi:MAG TPA: hypothetical protein VI968_03350 [archaeon]|nr:hypothetical protein [archaeon]